MVPSTPPPTTSTIGMRLRRVRHARGWTLREVEERSGRRFTVGSVGAYERGTRTLSAERLVALCALYDVDPADVLDEPEAETSDDLTIIVDLTVVEDSDETELALLCDRVVRMRRGHEGRYLELRDSDLELLAALRGVPLGVLAAELRAAGVAVTPRPAPPDHGA